MKHEGRIVCSMFLAITAALSACQGEPKPPPPEPAQATRSTRPLLRELRWESIEGAERYELRVWASHRLLFETMASDTLLTLTPVQQRSIAAFDSVRLVVRALVGAEPVEGSKRTYRLGS